MRTNNLVTRAALVHRNLLITYLEVRNDAGILVTSHSLGSQLP